MLFCFHHSRFIVATFVMWGLGAATPWMSPTPVVAQETIQDAADTAADTAGEAADQPDESSVPKRGADKPKSQTEKFVEALDRFERKIAEQERRGTYGNETIEDWAVALEQEYKDNAKLIARQRSDQSDTEAVSDSLWRRQQHIALLLWQLRRVSSEIARADRTGRQLTREIHELLSDFRDATKDPKLMRRFSDLSRRATQLSQQRYLYSASNSFHFVHPNVDADREDSNDLQTSPSTSEVERRLLNLQDGPLQTLAEPIGDLIRLGWKDGKLQWDEEHWIKPFAGQTLESIDQQVSEELKRRGVTLDEKDQMIGFRKKRLFETPTPMLLFQNLQYIASSGGRASRSYSSGGALTKSRFSINGIEAELSLDAEQVLFSVREETADGRVLRVEKNADGTLRVRVIGSQVMLLEQAADGAVRWIHIDSIGRSDQATVISAESFAEFYRQHPQLVERDLFRRLRHFGIHTPMQRFHQELVDRALVRLRGVAEPTRRRFEQLVDQIDGGNFRQRQAAYRELGESIDAYSIMLVEMDQNEDRSPEAVARLDDLQKRYDQAYRRVDTLLNRTGWLDDPDYLVGLLDRVDAEQAVAVIDRLRKLSGEDFGGDVDRWRAWLKQR